MERHKEHHKGTPQRPLQDSSAQSYKILGTDLPQNQCAPLETGFKGLGIRRNNGEMQCALHWVCYSTVKLANLVWCSGLNITILRDDFDIVQYAQMVSNM